MKIERSDTRSEVEYGSAAIIYGMVGANPTLDVIDGFVRRIWSTRSIDKVVLARKEVFLVRFLNVQDKQRSHNKGSSFLIASHS